ncbi:MAG: ElyC/SanA/YdcF family protein, partial [Novosphingobium sp.]
AVDTRSNAVEATRWVKENKLRSVRLVTTDWHMRRAAFDLSAEAPTNLIIVEDAVPSKPSFRILFIEYNKYVARLVVWLGAKAIGW